MIGRHRTRSRELFIGRFTTRVARNGATALVAITAILVTASGYAGPLASAEPSGDCAGGEGVIVQVLGSGGPIADDGRAGSGYVVRVDGRARVLIDAGGGVFQRFGAVGATIEDLKHVGITHFHADHTSDFPALVKSSYFARRAAPLSISGPEGGRGFPSLEEFLTRQFDERQGVYGYLSGILDGSDRLFRLVPHVVDHQRDEPQTVYEDDELSVQAVGVPHGPVPALGYLVTIGEQRIAFSGDQNGSGDGFWKLAGGADLLIMDHAVPEQADRIARNLHAVPSVIGRRAQEAGIRRLVLSHLMARSLTVLDANMGIIRERYNGSVDVARDLACYRLQDT